MTENEQQELCQLAVENERLEGDLQVAMLTRDLPGSVALIHRLQNGLCRASTLARRHLGLPTLREERRNNDLDTEE